MTREQDIRKEVLLQLYAARPLAVSPALLARQARKAGLDFTAREIGAECAFLVGQAMASETVDKTSGELKYAITSQGIIEYENSRP